jgi:putative tricarboxylic transport membrane protein
LRCAATRRRLCLNRRYTDALAAGNGEAVVLRCDHIAGGASVAFGALVLAVSGDLPVGTLSFPGAGMMPKLMAALLIVFGLLLVVRADESPPLASLPWSDLPHAARVVLITAAAIALYQTLGFLLAMALMLFALTVGAERRHPLAAAAFSIGVVALTYLLFAVALKTPLERGVLGF